MKLFTLTEQLFNFLSTPLGQPIGQPVLPHAYSCVKSAAPASVCGDMRFNLALKHFFNEAFVKEPLVCSKTRRSETESSFGSVEQPQRPLFFRGTAAKDFHPYAQKDSIAVLHQSVDRIARVGSCARTTLGDKPTIGIRRRAMGLVATLFTAKIYRWIPWNLRMTLIVLLIGAAKASLVLLRDPWQLQSEQSS